jgi:hypothetical protein
LSNRLLYGGARSAYVSPNLIPAGVSDPRVKGDHIRFDNGVTVDWARGYREGVSKGRAYTTDSFMTFDEFSYTKDSTGSFLIGELERLDQTLHDPLVAVTWGRDIDLREDVTIADEVSSFTNSSFASAGGVIPTGKAWLSKDANQITGVALDIGKTTHPLYLWAMELKYTMPELASAQKIGRPIDVQKYDGLKLKYQMDVDEMVYIGDTSLGQKGLINNDTLVSFTNAAQAGATSPTGQTTSLKWIDKTPDAILADVNTALTQCWTNSGWAVMPTELRLPPVEFGYLVSQKVSSAGNVSVLEFLRNNSLSNAAYGRPLNIQPVKWLTGRGAGNTDRVFVYTKERDRVRFPLVPLQRTPLEFRNLYQITCYFGRLGCVEFVYPECCFSMDGIG